MHSLIYLVHRIPYPPNKGDKIRSYHWLRFLAERYRVHLGTFVDEASDWQHVAELESICADVCAVGLSPLLQRLRSLTGLFSGEALTVPYYRNRELKTWVENTMRDEDVARIVVFSSPMAQYVPRSERDLRKIIDFVDVDSEKWCQYAERRRWPMSWIYRREGARLLDFEQRVAAKASASVFVTDEEAALFKERAPDVTTSIRSVVNGVDTDYFSPERAYPRPADVPERGPVLVFTGRMDYWANVDAVRWFAETVFPSIRERHPDACFCIVGAQPTRSVTELAGLPGVVVTGAVPDVRPYLAHATAAVAPMRIARGIQNKVLEAMAMARPVVATSAAIEGLDVPECQRTYIVDTPDEIAASVDSLVRSDRTEELGSSLRAWARGSHDWNETLKPLEGLIA